MPETFIYGFRIIGSCAGQRQRVHWRTAFDAYAVCDERAQVEREAYLSAFTFDEAFRTHLDTYGTTKAFNGHCFGPWIWFDLDREAAQGGIDAALRGTRTLAVRMCDSFAVDEDSLLVFYSGSKGFHIGLPTAGFSPSPTLDFHRIARRFAENAASAAGVVIDTGVYDKVRAFRAPNSRHRKTGRHKRNLTFDELMHLSANRIIELAAKPEAFEIPDASGCGFELPAAWSRAADEIRQEADAQAERHAAMAHGETPVVLNRLTLDFIRDGASNGDRHRLLFSAAANLSEFGCPRSLAHALLTESALDCGLPPAEVHRQIDCGMTSAISRVQQVQAVFPKAHLISSGAGGAT